MQLGGILKTDNFRIGFSYRTPIWYEFNDETSQYLKVLSRVENLLLHKKLPDAAIEGFVSAVKNQIDSLGEEDRQIILKLTESTELGLKNLDDLPNMIKENLKNLIMAIDL